MIRKELYKSSTCDFQIKVFVYYFSAFIFQDGHYVLLKSVLVSCNQANRVVYQSVTIVFIAHHLESEQASCHILYCNVFIYISIFYLIKIKMDVIICLDSDDDDLRTQDSSYSTYKISFSNIRHIYITQDMGT